MWKRRERTLLCWTLSKLSHIVWVIKKTLVKIFHSVYKLYKSWFDMMRLDLYRLDVMIFLILFFGSVSLNSLLKCWAKNSKYQISSHESTSFSFGQKCNASCYQYFYVVVRVTHTWGSSLFLNGVVAVIMFVFSDLLLLWCFPL